MRRGGFILVNPLVRALSVATKVDLQGLYTIVRASDITAGYRALACVGFAQVLYRSAGLADWSARLFEQRLEAQTGRISTGAGHSGEPRQRTSRYERPEALPPTPEKNLTVQGTGLAALAPFLFMAICKILTRGFLMTQNVSSASRSASIDRAPVDLAPRCDFKSRSRASRND